MAVRRRIVRPSHRDDDVEVEEVRKSKREVVEEDPEDELDEVPAKKAAEEEEDIPEIFRTPAKKVVVPPPVAKKIVPPTKPVEVQEELPLEKPDFQTKTVNDVVLDNMFIKVMEHLGMGQELVIFKVSGDKWTIKIPGNTVGNAEGLKVVPADKPAKASKAVTTKLSGKEYEQEVCSQEYLDFVF